jgi:hypothetical protein
MNSNSLFWLAVAGRTELGEHQYKPVPEELLFKAVF